VNSEPEVNLTLTLNLRPPQRRNGSGNGGGGRVRVGLTRHVYVCIYVYMYICVCIYIYIYIYIYRGVNSVSSARTWGRGRGWGRLAFTRYPFTLKLVYTSQSSVHCSPSPLYCTPHCNTIARPWCNVRPPPAPPFVCYTRYNIGNDNIV